MIDNGGDGQMTPLLRLAAGAGAGIVGMSATYPLDMVISSHTTAIILAQPFGMTAWQNGAACPGARVPFKHNLSSVTMLYIVPV